MLESELFLGFAIDPIFEKKLASADPQSLKNFIGNKEFLWKVSYEGIEYLGKPVGKKATLSSLDLVENNIFSLLKRVLPDYPYEETPLYLFPYDTTADSINHA